MPKLPYMLTFFSGSETCSTNTQTAAKEYQFAKSINLKVLSILIKVL